MTTENRQEKRRKYDDLFTEQMARLKKASRVFQPLSWYRTMTEYTENYRIEVVDRAMQLKIPDNHIPFIPCWNPLYFGVLAQVKLLGQGKKKARWLIDPTEIEERNQPPRPSSDYFLMNVAFETEESETQKRIPLLLREAIQLALHKNQQMQEHSVFLYAGGSKIVRLGVDVVPVITFSWLEYPGTPMICSGDQYKKHKWASCRELFVPPTKNS